MTADFFWQLMIALGACASVYVAIRVDLAVIKFRAEQAAESAKEAHGRLDIHINDHVRGKHG